MSIRKLFQNCVRVSSQSEIAIGDLYLAMNIERSNGLNHIAGHDRVMHSSVNSIYSIIILKSIILICQLHISIYRNRNIMLKDSTSKVVPNKFIFQEEQDYIGSNKIKSKVKPKHIGSEPLDDHTHKLSTLQNYAIPQNLQLVGYENDDPDQQKLQQLETKQNRVSQEQRTFKKKEDNSNKQNMENFTHQKNLKLNDKQVIRELSEGLSDKECFSLSKKQQNFLNEKLTPLRQVTNSVKLQEKECFYKKKSPEQRKRIFNIELSDESSEQEQKTQKKLNQIEKEVQRTQPKQLSKQQDKSKKICQQTRFNHQIQEGSQQEQQKKQQELLDQADTINIFEGLKQNKKANISKFHVQFSQSSEQQQIKKEAIITPRNTEKKKIILDKFNTEQDQGKQSSSQDKSQQEDYLQIMRNMNYQKLKSHFQFIKIDANFLAFCPVPAEHKISLIVKRDTSNSQYTVFDNQLVCQIMKIEKKIGGTYKFIMVKDPKDSKSEMKQIGKMKSNFLGTQFHCYTHKYQNKEKEKYQCISIKYDVNILGLNGPRKTKLYAVTKPLPSQMSLLQTYQKNKSKHQIGIKVYQNKTPKWLPQLNAYVLNLRGTATHSSIKNCIIVDSTNENKQHLIFGKKAKDIFNLEIKHPMTVIQGVAFAVSSFERKLACE